MPNDETGSLLVIKVKDTGIGIPENQQQHIFDRFYQLDNSHTRKTEGTGIGLALTTELVKLMEGEITVKSPPTGANKGTEFTVLLPLKKLPATEEISNTKIEDGFVKKVREAIEQHLTDTNFTVEQLCKLLFMSHSQLHSKLDALTGCSPNKFIRIIRLNKAKDLLKDPANSIAVVALECGYSDPGYFARVFKQEYDVTPQEWRMNN